MSGSRGALRAADPVCVVPADLTGAPAEAGAALDWQLGTCHHTYEDGHRAPDDYARQFGWTCVVWRLPRPASKLRVPPKATLPTILDARGLQQSHKTLTQGWHRVEGYARLIGAGPC